MATQESLFELTRRTFTLRHIQTKREFFTHLPEKMFTFRHCQSKRSVEILPDKMFILCEITSQKVYFET